MSKSATPRERVAAWLQDKSLSKISTKTGISRSTLWLYRKGEGNMTMANYEKLEPLMRAAT
jgi:transcriptional regulator with XRE-family HTH domain